MEITISTENLVGVCFFIFLAYVLSLGFAYFFGKYRGFTDGVNIHESTHYPHQVYIKGEEIVKQVINKPHQ